MHPTVTRNLIIPLLLMSALSIRSEDRHEVEIHSLSGKRIVLYESSYAIVIGVSDYKYGWQHLPNALRNAEAVAEALKRRHFNVMTIFNPTGSELKEVIDSLTVRNGSENDRFIFYFAGHGETITEPGQVERGYIVPVDAPNPKKYPDRFLSKAISMRNIADAAKASEVKHALFLFDCCFSGSILSHGWSESGTNHQDFDNPARQFITAGAKNERVPDNSIFTYCLLAALNDNADLNGDGFITASELSIYIRDNTLFRSKSSLHPQYGRIHDPRNNRGDFLFRIDLPKTKPIDQIRAEVSIHTENDTTTNDNLSILLPDFRFTYIPAGRFKMGSPLSEKGRDDDEGPVHQVEIKPFYMQTTEVTQRLWKAVMGYNPSFFMADVLPVEQVSWNEVQLFLQRLNELDPGKDYRLPTEAEWEYACRAETTTRFPWGNDVGYHSLDIFAWITGGADGRTHPIGQKRPNAWGLYDMHGNVFEWCQDWYHDDYYGAPEDGSAWVSPVGEYRAHRGGSSVMTAWEYNARRSRSAFRSRSKPASRHYDLGFRLVKEVK